MELPLRVYRFVNMISIDVACGAMVCAAFFARILQIQLRPQGLAALGVTVWIIYSIDHLLDANQLPREASTRRHLFHQRNFDVLAVLVGIAIVIDLVLIFYIRIPIFKWGTGLSIAVFLYLLFQRQINPLKEFVAAILYAGGVLLPSLALQTNALSVSSIILMIVFILTVLTNLILFSWFDVERDLRDTQNSFVTYFGRKSTKTFLRSLFLIQWLFLLVLIIESSNGRAITILFFMNLTLFAIFIFSERFVKEEYYRLAGDVIFLFPLPYLMLNG